MCIFEFFCLDPASTSILVDMSSQTSVIVGIILLNDSVQLLDVAPVDMLGMISPDWLRFAQVPDEVVKKAPTFEFRFVNETGKGPNGMTAGFGLEVTVNFPCGYLPSRHGALN